MYRNITDYYGIFIGGNNFNFSLLIQTIIFTVLFISLYTDAFAQWVNNPAANTRLVTDIHDPIDMSAVRDFNGGAFLFWQDNKNGFQNEVYFIHVDEDGNINLKADGKKISTLTGPEENPVCSESLPNSAVVVWDDYTYSRNGNLYAQRVMNNGNYVWTDFGLKITNTGDGLSQYSLSTDSKGFAYIAYVAKEPDINGSYKIEFQKVSPDGKLMFSRDSTMLYRSRERKMMTSVIPDGEGGAFVFWIEMRNGKSMILSQHINSNHKETWGKKPLEISNVTQNVINYVAKAVDNQSAYLAWQTQKKTKEIYHQIINLKGKMLWTRGGRLATHLKGNQINAEAIFSDSTVILSWTNDREDDKDIFIQKYNLKGKPLWNKNGIPVIRFHGEQFGQKIIGDNKGGAIVAWVDLRLESTYANIYAQRINEAGKIIWDSLGVAVASNYNTPKSYLSLIPDESGGAIAAFKNYRNGSSIIYGQKIFNNGTYVSQITGFQTELSGDSIKIVWYTTNERGKTKYNIERAVPDDKGNSDWNIIGSINSDGKNANAKYEYYDVPSASGTLYYRVVEADTLKNRERSEISMINYFGSSSDIIVAQNTPNPFSDSTVISFYLPDSEPVTIEFFDDHVERISEIDKSFPAGENTITFYSKGLKRGIYFYRFKANDFVDVKKMILTN